MQASSVMLGATPMVASVQVKPLVYVPPTSSVVASRTCQTRRITLSKARRKPARAQFVSNKVELELFGFSYEFHKY